MQVTVTVSDELALEAQAQGLPLETYVERLVEQADRSKGQRGDEDERRRQAVRDMLEFTEKHRFTLGEGLRLRDLIHESHKY